MTARPLRILIADDHEIVREGLRMLLSEERELELIGEAVNGAEALARAADLRPDVILMDLMMPDMDGIEATRRLRQVCPATQVLILTSFADEQKVREAIQAGAIGYLLKDVLRTDLLRALRAAAAGRPTLHPEAQRHLMQQIVAPVPRSLLADLTARECGVLRLLARGKSNKEIGVALHLTEGTVKGYVSAILTKLEVSDRTQAALYAVKHGLELEA
jgi:DNA-binding NarL/FixJ family response regulator